MTHALKRFWKIHVSDAYSGEVHVETTNLKKILDLLAQYEVTSR